MSKLNTGILRTMPRSNGQVYGIRDDGGFLVVFPEIMKWEGQDERYKKECQEQQCLANVIIAAIEGSAE